MSSRMGKRGALAAATLIAVAASWSSTALAQVEEGPDETEESQPKPKKRKVVVEEEEGGEAKTDEAPAKPKKAAAAAATTDEGAEEKQPSVSIAFERLGGFAYATAGQSNSETTFHLTVLNIGGINVNPYGAPRLGVDFGLGSSNFWIGGALGMSISSAGSSGGGKSQDVGTLTIYSLSPRVGYRFALDRRWDITPRAGFTLAGGSLSTDGGQSSTGVFSAALSVEGLAAFRVTNSWNFLGGLALDRTIAASVSDSSKKSGTTSSSSTQDIDGALLNIQLWLGMGGYLP